MEILQNFIYPESKSFGSQEKYFRATGEVKSLTANELQMTRTSSVVFDTYYNSFSIPLWRTKVGVGLVEICLAGTGSVELELFQYHEGEEKFLDSVRLQLTEELQKIFELDLNHYEGLIYPRIKALEGSTIRQMVWMTEEERRRPVKLGISITSFNRRDYLLPAIHRLKESLLDDGEWQQRIDLQVVDNASNLLEGELQGIRLIPNENTGGSGGFMRGFLHYKNETEATHVLFMDDDAALEMESIKRAYQILQFAKSENAAVGAALFYENEPDKLISWGEYLGKFWVNVDFANEDARSRKLVLAGEKNWESSRPDTSYMGWWFAAFPISAVKKLVPPFFVRGDDMIFGQINDFDVIYANGIASYAEDFQKKLTPMSTYLDQRNILLFYAFRSSKVFSLVFYYAALHITSLLTGRYEYSKLYKLALDDFLKLTAESLVASAHIAPKLKEINSYIQLEALKEITPIELVKAEKKPESTIVSLLRVIFKPLKNGQVNQEFLMLPDWQNIAGHQQIQYYRLSDHKAFTVTVSRWKLFKGLLSVLAESFRLAFAFRGVRRRLLAKFDYLTSEEMWQEIFSGGADD